MTKDRTRQRKLFYLAAYAALGLAASFRSESAIAQERLPESSCIPSAWAAERVACDTDCDSTCTKWEVFAGVNLLNRNGLRRQPTLIDPLTPSVPTLLDGGEFSFATASQLDATYLTDVGEFNVGLMIGGDWQSQAAFGPGAFTAGIGGLQLDSVLILPVTEANFSYSSRLYSGEFNFRRRWNERFTPFIGIRWLEFDDRYAANGIEAGSGDAFSQTIRATNTLWGGQVGAIARIIEGGNRFSLDAATKLGVFGNSARTTAGFSDNGGFGNFSANGTARPTSFLAEIEVTGRYQLTERAAIRGGYHLLWLDRLALAPRQADGLDLAASTAELDTSGGLFAHGATVGLEFRW